LGERDRPALTKGEQMRRVRSRDTGPERVVRSVLSALGVRYRLQRRDLPGRPDLYIPRLRFAIFVNGCFWHGHDCPRGKRPASNVAFWNAKIEKNLARDERTKAALDVLGIESLIVWTCRIDEFDSEARTIAERYRRGI
jgi:DNA mismatch endonuclease (patch repair protein)